MQIDFNLLVSCDYIDSDSDLGPTWEIPYLQQLSRGDVNVQSVNTVIVILEFWQAKRCTAEHLHTISLP